jgi:hypothetical protein
MGQTGSQLLQFVQFSWLSTNLKGEILLNGTSTAPRGQRYLHQNRLFNNDVNTKVINTDQSSVVVSWKLKMARAGQISRKGGYTAQMLAKRITPKIRYLKLRSQASERFVICTGISNLFSFPSFLDLPKWRVEKPDRISWKVPMGHIQPQKARPASKETPRTPRAIEKFNGEVVFKVSPVVT